MDWVYPLIFPIHRTWERTENRIEKRERERKRKRGEISKTTQKERSCLSLTLCV